MSDTKLNKDSKRVRFNLEANQYHFFRKADTDWAYEKPYPLDFLKTNKLKLVTSYHNEITRKQVNL